MKCTKSHQRTEIMKTIAITINTTPVYIPREIKFTFVGLQPSLCLHTKDDRMPRMSLQDPNHSQR